ncbi:MAG: hypothetical protein KDD38_00880 [Bdellovibrionales bacterium]|nr:hypothetical protein [Bdellovibrionales bacterium]
MKISFLNGLILVLAQAFVLQANANIDVNCIMEDCLTEGWQSFDQRSGESNLTVCRDNDCNLSGWHNEYKEKPVSEVECKPEGCFNEGWKVYDARNGNLLSDVTCQSSFSGSACLQFGWTTYQPGRATITTRCLNGDCRNSGWDVYVPGYAPQSVRCKRGGCFTIGWTVYQ